jgi:hypothetical protein
MHFVQKTSNATFLYSHLSLFRFKFASFTLFIRKIIEG